MTDPTITNSSGSVPMKFDGERFVPECHGTIELEHIHRYLFARKIVAGKNVLDIASGEGYGSNMLAAAAKHVTGVDISAEAVEHAKRRYSRPNLTFVTGDCAQIPLSNGSVDVVVSFETIEHHVHHIEMMREVKRVLRTDGILLISSPDKLTYSDDANQHNPFHVKELYEGEFRDLLGAFFHRVVLCGQRVIYGSAIVPSAISSVFCTQAKGPGEIANIQGLNRPLYWLAVASDHEIPELPTELLEQPIYESDTANILHKAIADRNDQIGVLNQFIADRDASIRTLSQTVADRDGRIVALNESIADRDASIRTLSQTVADRDGRIVARNESIADRDASIRTLSQTVADRDSGIAALNQAIADRDGQIAHLSAEISRTEGLLFNSESERRRIAGSISYRLGYRLTRPLSAGKELLLRLRQGFLSLKRRGPISTLRIVRRTMFPGTLRPACPSPVNSAEPANPPPVPTRKRPADAPSFSVIIPTFNRSSILPPLLNAWRIVQKSTSLKFELIFSDDGSTDNTCAILEGATDLPLRLIRNPHKGVSHARNRAIMEALGHKLFITGDDIFPSPNILNEHARWLGVNGSRNAVLGRIDWHPDIMCTYLMKHICEIGNEQFSFNCFPPFQHTDFRHFYTSNVSIDADFLRSEWPLFDERFEEVNFEDIELAYRLAKRGMTILYNPDALAFHHHVYTDWRAFMRRQEAAGRMAVTLTRLHPEMAKVVPRPPECATLLERLFSATDLFARINLLSRQHTTCAAADLPALEKALSSAMTEAFRLAFLVGQFAGINGIPAEVSQIPLTERLAAAPGSIQSALPATSPRMAPRISVLVKASGGPSEAELSAFHDSCGTRHLIVEEGVSGYSLRPLDAIPSISPYPDLASIPCDYICLTPGRQLPNRDAVLQGLLCVSVIDYDYLIIQPRTDIPVAVNPVSDGSCVFCRPALAEHFRKGVSSQPPGRGRLVRVMTIQPAVRGRVVADASCFPVDQTGEVLPAGGGAPARRRSCLSALPQHVKSKPTILVLPVFMAVGGVERNTLAIMRALRETHDFVVVTFEKHTPATGTLHRELEGLAQATFDLADLAPNQEHFLSHLTCIRDSFMPDAVWICNGSPWLFDHAADIRELFSTVPIVDQTIYDTEVGWITRHREAGPQCFDHFIAINSQIRRKLIDDYRVPCDEISLIYSVMDETRLELMRQPATSKKEIRQKLGLPTDGYLFCFAGRFSAQKQPLRFVDVARRSQSNLGISFVMIGDGPLRNEVEDAARDLPNIRLLGFRDDLIAIYGASDGLVVTSDYEGLPIAMLEAMACGTPVFATDVGDIRAIVERYGSGVVVSRGIGGDELYLEFCKWLDKLPVYAEQAKMSAEQVKTAFSPAQAAPLYERAWFQKKSDKEENALTAPWKDQA